MELNVKKLEQGPVMAAKGDTEFGGVAKAGPVVVDRGCVVSPESVARARNRSTSGCR